MRTYVLRLVEVKLDDLLVARILQSISEKSSKSSKKKLVTVHLGWASKGGRMLPAVILQTQVSKKVVEEVLALEKVEIFGQF